MASTDVDPRGITKIWSKHTVPLDIKVTNVWPFSEPVTETSPEDHNTFSDIFTWVKKPVSPFPSE
jgi:hypothetical protein